MAQETLSTRRAWLSPTGWSRTSRRPPTGPATSVHAPERSSRTSPVLQTQSNGGGMVP